MGKKESQYKIGEEDKVGLYQEFFKLMLDFGYDPFFIGQELAFIARALNLADGGE